MAPFSGVITKRNVDVGDLIDAGGGAGRALFVLTQTDPLRVYVNVPQSYAQLVKPGQQVTVTQAELRGKGFKGEVARTAASIDAATRTMQVEIALPNKDGVAAAGRLRAGRAAAAAERRDDDPDQRADDPRRGPARGGGRRRRPRAACARCASAATTARRSRCSTASPDSDRLVLNPPDSLNDGDEVSVVAARDKEEKKK